MGEPGQLAGFLAVHRTRRVHHLTDRLVAAILEGNPAYERVPLVSRADLHRSCHDNIVRVLELLALRVAGDDPPVSGPYFDAARSTGSRRAEQGMALDDVLRSFRVGGRLIWEDLIAQAGPVGLLDGDDLRVVGTELWRVVDDTSAHVAEAYHAAQRLQVRADEERRAVLWEGLLSGRGVEPGFAVEAARALGLSPQGTMAVAVVGHTEGSRTTTTTVVQRLRAIGVRSAWQHRTAHQVGVLELPDPGLGASVDTLRHWGAPVGLSSAVDGLGSTGAAFQEALLALRTVPTGESSVALYEERLAEALLLSSPEVADRLVDLWLGPLLALPDREAAQLLETLEMWVAAGGSASRTAALVPCHRNTVVNRIRRIVAVTGRELGEDTPPIELSLALRGWRLTRPD